MKILLEGQTYWNAELGVEIVSSTPEEWWIVLRDLRDVLLKESDWIVGVDSPATSEVVQEWINWRQAMRDLPQNLVLTDDDGIIEIPEPPVFYRPKTWVNVEAETLLRWKKEAEKRIQEGYSSFNSTAPTLELTDVVE